MKKKPQPFLRFLSEYYFVVAVVVAALLTMIFVFFGKSIPVKAGNELDIFAACLKDKGVVMYGVDTCAECQNQKKIFGRSFDNINHVNCDFQKAAGGACDLAGYINPYPMWVYKEQVLFGFQPFSKLALMSGCQVPVETLQR